MFCVVLLRKSTEPVDVLINPSKTDLGKMSKRILDRILPGIRKGIRLKQWRNTDAVIGWFRGLGNRRRTKFLQLDIEAYYPSITFGLLIICLALYIVVVATTACHIGR